MSEICLAGRADDIQFARAELMAYFLNANLPHYLVNVEMKTPEDWEEYRAEIYKKNKWDQRRAADRTYKKIEDLPQMVWRSSGELIGNTEDYLKLVKHAYNQELTVEQQQLIDISKENFVSASQTKYNSMARLVDSSSNSKPMTTSGNRSYTSTRQTPAAM